LKYTGKNFYKSGLSRAIVAYQGDYFTSVNVEVNTGKRGHGTKILGDTAHTENHFASRDYSTISVGHEASQKRQDNIR
jgi:hypothetical protein